VWVFSYELKCRLITCGNYPAVVVVINIVIGYRFNALPVRNWIAPSFCGDGGGASKAIVPVPGSIMNWRNNHCHATCQPHINPRSPTRCRARPPDPAPVFWCALCFPASLLNHITAGCSKKDVKRDRQKIKKINDVNFNPMLVSHN
jgi:hypothetical protein